MADFLLPGYSIPGLGFNHSCLRWYPSNAPQEWPAKNPALFDACMSLRLYCPNYNHIAGAFRVGDLDYLIHQKALYELKSPWCPDTTKHYKATDIKAASAIADHIAEISGTGPSRITTGLIFFSHVTLGQVKSYQLATLGLFAALEALFVPNGNKARTISDRVSRFLEGFEFSVNLDEWVRNAYVSERDQLAHGIHDATFDTEMRPNLIESFGRLHEICRLSLLGFLSMDNAELEKLEKSRGKALQALLDDRGPAAGDLVDNQRNWAK
ncbi:MAG: hypothetical protein NTW07_05285 [candidate division Zixibacteria bacterium]|nr:hypothetical protein [candidate division Zixibacteria bacterium]